MKTKMKKFTAAFLCCVLSGCSAANDTTTPAQTAENDASPVQTAAKDIAEAEMPVLSISTADGKNDFAVKPVDAYVSSQIATWTPGYVIPPAPYYADCTVSLSDGSGNVLLAPADAQVKVRGNWTTNYDKKPLRIKFAEKQSLLGLDGGAAFKNWVLLAEYKDASMLRNKSALEMSRAILSDDGLYASDSAFVQVELNGEYRGVYLLAELQQVNEDRINITDYDDTYSGTDIGYLLEFDGNYFNEEPLQQFYVDYHKNVGLTPFDGQGGGGKTMRCLPLTKNDPKKEVGFTIKNDIVSEEQHDFIASYVNNVYRIMYEAAYYDKANVFTDDYSDIIPADITPQEAIEAVVDVNSLADMYIISELTCDADLYWSSFFMTADFGAEGNKKLTFQAPWDFDSAMGNKDRCADGTGFYAANIIPDVNTWEYETINPWLAVLMYEDWYQDIIRDKWTKVYDSGVFDTAIDGILTDSAMYRSAFAANNDKWGITTKNDSVTGELCAGAMSCSTQEEAAGYLADWLGKRVEFMNNYWHR